MNPDENHCMSEEIENILEFWFGHDATASEMAAEKSAMWWSKNEQIDRTIIRRFAAVTEAAVAGRLARWAESPRGLLALIISLDQFPRNMHRDSPQAFMGDSAALNHAKHGVDSGVDQRLSPMERVFAYLPFEHSEELAEQRRSVALYETLAASAAPAERELFAGYHHFARQHLDIIERFKRFPHRNKIVQRRSTDEEIAFLQQPNSSF